MDKDYAINLLINTLIANSVVTGLVGQRIFPDHLSVIDTPVFPLITIYDGGSKRTTLSKDANWYNIIIEIHSVKYASECYDIMKAVNDVIHPPNRLADTNYWLIILSSQEDGVKSMKDSAETRYYEKINYKTFAIKRT